ncbi:hypothetical protein NEF87_001733 [Candidatus Lokiarchaeum ossiferum]|uniref:DUF1048 domain-containing protein n=1 Tax=Candidatus Lokiarchaeum ossiferum TaxID=2951803 RepID=A0ABY6HPJ9_9ARCH|nr:hypothetical protein NEF87_001733 [Candidatus Lokiarchaeum sp. B-35]
MSHEITTVKEYLKIIEEGLHEFSDKKLIVQELRDYIWDLANDIGLSSGKDHSECFKLALKDLEDPINLVTQFKQENLLSSLDYSPLIVQKKISKKKWGIFSVFTLAFVYILIRIANFAAFQPGFILRNSFIVFLIAISVIGLIYLIDDQAIKHQKQRIRRIFSKNKEDAYIHIGKRMIPIGYNQLMKTIRFILASMFLLFVIVVIILDRMTNFSCNYQYFIAENMIICFIALLIMSASMVLFNIKSLWFKGTIPIQYFSLANLIIKLVCLTGVLYYYPLNFEHLNSLTDQNIQSVLILILGCFFLNIVNLLYQILALYLQKTRNLQNQGEFKDE